MNGKCNIHFGVFLLLIAGSCLQACSEDAFEENIPEREWLIAEGRYLAARIEDAVVAADNPDKVEWFDVGTPYRLLAFSKPYNDPESDATPVDYPRFNTVAWEGETKNHLRFINIDSDPDKWFGFSALGDEPKGSDGLVSLDFYGFTYGEKVEPEDRPGYIELDELEGNQLPDKGALPQLTRTEIVGEDGKLKDLKWGKLLDQNIVTAGTDNDATQSIIPFRHCFTQLRFKTGQEGKDTDGRRVPCFEDISIEKVEVTGTYKSGSVYLDDCKVKLPDKTEATSRSLQFKEGYDRTVSLELVDIGEMIIFPSDGAALKNEDLSDGYSIGLNITVKSSNRTDIEQFLINTGGSAETVEEVLSEDGKTYYRGTIEKKSIIDNIYEKDLRCKQNTAYTLVIWFQKDNVRIISVIPQVEEWLPGEEDKDGDPWQNQALGQPQMFDNVVWSDRNLGADHFDPTVGTFEQTIGYFYQSGRNIPYFPFDTRDYYTDESKVEDNVTYYKMDPLPSPDKKRDAKLANSGSYDNTTHRFYPMVEDILLNMKRKDWGQKDDGGSKGADRIWTIEGEPAQLSIPEHFPENSYFDFKRGNFKESENMHWENGADAQPVNGAWVVPSSKDFMTIFPSTPDAGNITFRKGSNNWSPVNGWSTGSPMDNEYRTLRVTVPYYTSEMTDADEPKSRSVNYRKAWKTLHENQDAGITHLEAYRSDGGPALQANRNLEPDGDPEDGYASVYVISRDGDNEESLPDLIKNDKYKNNKEKYKIKTWGTIYAIKRVYTSQAYRMRWRVLCAEAYGTAENRAAALYVEICRYRCNRTDRMNEQNYMDYDWDHPAARIYFPICGLGDNVGTYINFGTECEYATSDPIESNGNTGAVHLKITGDDDSNAYIAVVRKAVDRKFCKQIRPVGGVNNSK